MWEERTTHTQEILRSLNILVTQKGEKNPHPFAIDFALKIG